MKQDKGYGQTGNLTQYFILETLPPQQAKEHRQSLQNKNPEQYKEYLEWEQKIK